LKNTLSLVALLLLFVTTLVGCGNSRTTYGQLQEGFISVVDPIVAAREAGQIDDRTYNTEIMPLIRTGNTALNDMDAATQAGADPSAFRSIVRNVTKALADLYVRSQQQ
jgi:hypothetical protein